MLRDKCSKNLIFLDIKLLQYTNFSFLLFSILSLCFFIIYIHLIKEVKLRVKFFYFSTTFFNCLTCFYLFSIHIIFFYIDNVIGAYNQSLFYYKYLTTVSILIYLMFDDGRQDTMYLHIIHMEYLVGIIHTFLLYRIFNS